MITDIILLKDESRKAIIKDKISTSGINCIYYVTTMEELNKLWISYDDQTTESKETADNMAILVYGVDNATLYNDIVEDINRSEYEKIKKYKIECIDEDTIPSEIPSMPKFDFSCMGQKFGVGSYGNPNVIITKAVLSPQDILDSGSSFSEESILSSSPDYLTLFPDFDAKSWFLEYSMEYSGTICNEKILFERNRIMKRLYEDYDELMESGDTDKINARKQSILDLGEYPVSKEWIKSIAETSKRTINLRSKIVDKYYDLTGDVDVEEPLEESIKHANLNYPIFIVLTKGTTPILSNGIRAFTNSEYTHASISTDKSLREMLSFNIRNGNNGLIVENIEQFGERTVSVFIMLLNKVRYNKITDSIANYRMNKDKTSFDLRIFAARVMNLDKRPTDYQYKQVCSTFVDDVLRQANVKLTNSKIPSPGEILNSLEDRVNNKDIFHIYEGKASEYNKTNINKKIIYANKMTRNTFIKSSPDSPSLQEKKQLGVRFDKDSNLIIKNILKQTSYAKMINESAALLKIYKDTANLNGMKYELAKLNYILEVINKKIDRSKNKEDLKKLVDDKAIALNVFKSNLKYVSEEDNTFNFTEYYEETPFSDSTIVIDKQSVKSGIDLFKYISKI